MKDFKKTIGILIITGLFLCGCTAKPMTSSTTESEKSAVESEAAKSAQDNTSEGTGASEIITETISFVDSCGRTVELPKTIRRVAPSGSVAQMILYSVAPEKLIGWSRKPGVEALSFFPANYSDLPEFGQFYGKSVTLNVEALIGANPDVIIDLGDKKPTHAEDMDGIQKKTGIPTIFIEANLATFAEAYRTLGTLLEVNEQAEACAAYIEKTVKMAGDNAAKLNADEQISVMFGTGSTGRDCNAKGSIHADVIELIGAKNAIEVPELSNKGGGNTISMEELLRFQPEVILFANNGPYKSVATDAEWAGLAAVKKKRVYEIPFGPYDFLSNPPSVNRVIGIRWLGNLLYPDLYDLDMVEEVKIFYRLFWHSEVTDDQVHDLLQNSTFKEVQP